MVRARFAVCVNVKEVSKTNQQKVLISLGDKYSFNEDGDVLFFEANNVPATKMYDLCAGIDTEALNETLLNDVKRAGLTLESSVVKATNIIASDSEIDVYYEYNKESFNGFNELLSI